MVAGGRIQFDHLTKGDVGLYTVLTLVQYILNAIHNVYERKLTSSGLFRFF